MKFILVAANAALLLVGGVNAWAQAADGTWVASNVFHQIRGSTVHESCTTMNTEDVHADGAWCEYWINGVGETNSGTCQRSGNSVLCI